jgi:transposase
MYIETVPNRNSRPAVLLREAWREGKKIRKRTIANLTSWPDEKIEALRRLLRDDKLIAAERAVVIERSIPHGHVAAVLGAIRKSGLETMISSRRCREGDLVIAMIAERLLDPCSKLATTRLWHTTTLAEELGVGQADEDDLYATMDWLLARQPRIEKNLAARHLTEGATVLYDVTSSYYEGHTCSLAEFGHNKDGKRGRPIIVYGMLADEKGRPIAVDVYPGNTGDPTTVPHQVEKLRKSFGLEHLVIVGDRGMLTQTQIERLKKYPEIGWISALRSAAIRKLTANKHIQMSIFDEKNLAEIHSPNFPAERLVACYNPALAEQRGRKRTELLAATEKDLAKIVREVARRTRTPLGRVEIAKKVGKVLNRFKMGKHYSLTIADGVFSYARKDEAIRRETQMDGLYVIRTSEPADKVSAEDALRGYTSLAQVERAFRCLKGVDLLVRPIRHRTEDHVRAHIFLCMLAYYVEWYMRKAWAPLLFEDEELEEARKRRDAVKPARPSASSKRKKSLKLTDDGLPVQSFQTLLAELGTLCRNKCRMGSDSSSPAFYQMTEPTPLQKRAFDLLEMYPVNGN